MELKSSSNHIEAAIEAILFTMGDSVKISVLSEVIGCTIKEIENAAKTLSDRYEASDSGIKIIQLNNAYQMCTNPAYYDMIIQLTKKQDKPSLTNVMLETLAIIAYKQPVTKADIEHIRGVSCTHSINKLLEYQLITEAGRLNAPGRPILFATTENFLRTFGVKSVEHLPIVSPEQIENLKQEAEEEIDLTI